jgi:hypothetical protein
MHTSGLHFIHEYAERQAQLPRARVEVRKRVAKNGRAVVKRDAWRLGVSCSALFGQIRSGKSGVRLD